MNQNNDKLAGISASTATVIGNAKQSDVATAKGVYVATCMRVVGSRLAEAEAICEQINALTANLNPVVLAQLQSELDSMPREQVWADTFANVVTTVGGNDMLDKYLAGSAYTAAFYMGLISATGYTSAPVIGDTAAAHSGWTEAGLANTPVYSQGARPTAAWSAAATKSKALSASLAFSFTSAGTVKGSFLSTIATKDSTTGILFSAGLFTGGDKTVAASDSVSVSYSLAI